jgi:hypothetical protein
LQFFFFRIAGIGVLLLLIPLLPDLLIRTGELIEALVDCQAGSCCRGKRMTEGQ